MYSQTFKSHWKLLVAPILIAAVVSAWFTFGAARTYRSSIALWIDNGVATASSMSDGTGSVGPATFEGQVLTELLSVPRFDIDVAQASKLVNFYTDGGSGGGFSPSVILSRRHPAPPLAQAAASVGYGVTAVAQGPQVLDITYTGPSPQSAQSVVRAVVAELGHASAKFGVNAGQAEAKFYSRKLRSATKVAQGTEGALLSYEQDHPTADAGDAGYDALNSEARAAAARVASLQLDNAAATNQQQAQGNATISVIDPATQPSQQVAGLGQRAVGLVVGALAGAIISLVALLLLAPSAKRPWDAELPMFERLARSERRGPDHAPSGGHAR